MTIFETNPFLNMTPPEQRDENPFVPPAPPPAYDPGTAVDKSELPPCGDIACKREGHRPDGSHYSTDKKKMYVELREDGKFGPQFGHLGGAANKKAKRAAEVVAEFARDNANDIMKVFADGIDDSQPIGVRMHAAKELIKIETDEEVLDLKKAEAEFNELTKDQLTTKIMQMMDELATAGAISREALAISEGDVVEAEVVEDA